MPSIAVIVASVAMIDDRPSTRIRNTFTPPTPSAIAITISTPSTMPGQPSPGVITNEPVTRQIDTSAPADTSKALTIKALH